MFSVLKMIRQVKKLHWTTVRAIENLKPDPTNLGSTPFAPNVESYTRHVSNLQKIRIQVILNVCDFQKTICHCKKLTIHTTPSLKPSQSSKNSYI